MGPFWSYCSIGMAGDGRRHGSDPFDVAARRQDAAPSLPDEVALSSDIPIEGPRRWPPLVKRWCALGLGVIVAGASAFVLARSISPPREGAVTQELAGRAPQRNYVASADLSPDWTHTRGLSERHRQVEKKTRRSRKPRRTTIRIGGGTSSTTTRVTTSAPSTLGAPGKWKGHGNEPKGHKNENEAAPAEPLPEPATPLYHLYRTFKKKKPNHYFTGDGAVKDQKIEEGWQFLATEGFMFDREYEGTVPVPADNGLPGYIYAKKEPGSLPLYMLRGYNGYGDIFTSDAAYKEKMIEEGWNDFVVVGYIAHT